jgi:hypothetical protein
MMKDAAEATELNQYSVEEPRSTDRKLRDARSLGHSPSYAERVTCEPSSSTTTMVKFEPLLPEATATAARRSKSAASSRARVVFPEHGNPDMVTRAILKVMDKRSATPRRR